MRVFFISILGFVVMFSCSKFKEDVKFSDDEIVETDSYGTIINTNGNTDWQAMHYEDDIHFHEVNRTLCFYISIPENETVVSCDSINNCYDSTLSFIAYPNPTSDGTFTLRIESPHKMLEYAIGYRRAGDDRMYGTGAGFDNGSQFSSDSTFVRIPQSSFSETYGNDLELYIALLTANNCIYYTKGKVKFK